MDIVRNAKYSHNRAVHSPQVPIVCMLHTERRTLVIYFKDIIEHFTLISTEKQVHMN